METRPAKAAARALDLACARVWPPEPVVLITGFWRAGTTWLQQSVACGLRAKTVFEPLSPRNPEYMAFLQAHRFSSYDTVEAFMPVLQDGESADPIWRYLADAFRGYCSGHFALLCRQSIGESLRRRTVVKCVRAAWSQRALHARFAVPVVHLRRHPCAIAASFAHTSWLWSFDRVSLAEAVHHIAERDRVEGPGVVALARRYDENATTRIAAYWALTERHVAGALHGQPWALTIDYEDAVHDPAATISRICEFLSRPMPGQIDTAGDSPVTEPDRRGAGAAARTSGWKSVLSPAAIDRILGIVAEIFPAYLEPSGPARRSVAAGDCG